MHAQQNPLAAGALAFAAGSSAGCTINAVWAAVPVSPPAAGMLTRLSLQSLALTSGVEHRLGSKLKRTAERRLAEAAQQAAQQGQPSQPAGRRGFGPKHSPGQPGRWSDKPPSRQQQTQQPAAAAAQASGAAADDDTDEEGGRGRAFGKRSHSAAHKPATFTRSDLLRVSGAQQPKKRKRKSGQGGGQAAAP
jgi:hypothetical protein